MNTNMQNRDQIAAVSEQIAQANAKAEACYTQIGKRYVALHASDYESEFKPFFEQILQAQQTIRDGKDRIRDLMGLVCCEKCGNDVPKDGAFCIKCGAALRDNAAAEDLSEKVRCDVCGKYVDKNEPFCPVCLMPMKQISEKAATQTVVEEEPPAEEVQVEQEVAPTPAQRVCPNCAKTVKDGFVFCTSCGHRMDDVPAETPTNRVCTVCGREVGENARFCVGCGNPVE